MTVVVSNEKIDPYVFVAGRNGKTLQAGEVGVLSDEEWDSVPFSQRGPGRLRAVWPSAVSSETNQVRFDYVLVGSSYEVEYLGYAVQSALDADEVWTIKKFDYTTLGTTNKPTHLQVMEGVAWSDRTTLSWT